MKINCPNCKSTFNVSEDLAGKKAKCSKCSTSFTINSSGLKEKAIESPVIDSNIDVNSNQSEYNKTETSTSISDRILRFSFSIANGISAFIVSLSLVIISILIAVIMSQILIPTKQNIPEKFTPPTFTSFQKQVETANNRNLSDNKDQPKKTLSTVQPDADFTSIDEQFDQYDKRLTSICSKYNLDVDIIEGWVFKELKLSVKDANLFVSGLETFLMDAEKYYTSQGRDRKTIQFIKGAEYYKYNFDSYWNNYKQILSDDETYNLMKAQERENRIKYCLIGLGSSISVLLLFLILPLLIQIERNTRTFKQFVVQED